MLPTQDIRCVWSRGGDTGMQDWCETLQRAKVMSVTFYIHNKSIWEITTSYLIVEGIIVSFSELQGHLYHSLLWNVKLLRIVGHNMSN